MRLTLLLASVFGAITLTSPPARSQVPVTDAGNLAHNAVTALNTVRVVLNTYQQIQVMENQLKYQLQSLETLNPASFNGLLSVINQSETTYAMLQGDLTTMGFTVSQINRDFDRMFPRSQSQWSSVRYSDFNGYYDRWNGELETSAKAAARAQASISALDASNRQIASILAQSNTATSGEVRQLQLMNQQLAVLHADLGSILQNLATTGRVLTDWAAGGVGEQMLARERARRRLDGYTNRGKPSRVLKALP